MVYTGASSDWEERIFSKVWKQGDIDLSDLVDLISFPHWV